MTKVWRDAQEQKVTLEIARKRRDLAMGTDWRHGQISEWVAQRRLRRQRAQIQPQPLNRHPRLTAAFPVASCNIFMRKLFCNRSNCRAHVTIIFTGCWLFTDLRNERWRRMEPRKWIRRCKAPMVPPAAPSPLLIKSGAEWWRILSRWVDSTVFRLCSRDHARSCSETQHHHVFQASSLSPICRSGTPEAMCPHRVTLPANGPNCDLIAKPWFSLFFPLTPPRT